MFADNCIQASIILCIPGQSKTRHGRKTCIGGLFRFGVYPTVMIVAISTYGKTAMELKET